MNDIIPLTETEKNIEENPVLKSPIMNLSTSPKKPNEENAGKNKEDLESSLMKKSLSPKKPNVNNPKRKKSSFFSKNKQNVLKFSQFRDSQKDKKMEINVLKMLKLKGKHIFKMKLNEEEEIFVKSKDCSIKIWTILK